MAWQEFSPLLDEAMNRLGQTDRDALLLRYFENKSLREVARPGHKRRCRQETGGAGLEKLRAIFVKRGFRLRRQLLPTPFLSIRFKPRLPRWQKSPRRGCGQRRNAGSSTLTLIKGALKLMPGAKRKAVVVVGAILLLSAGTVTVTIPKIRDSYLERKVVWALDSRVLEKIRPFVLDSSCHPIPA